MKAMHSFYVCQKTLRSLINHWLEEDIRFEVHPISGYHDEYLAYSYEEIEEVEIE